MTLEKRSRGPILYLHVGAAKTGTSALQSALAKNVDQLLAHGIAYPDDVSLAAARSDRVTSGNAVALANLLGAGLGEGIPTDHVWPEIVALRRLERDIVYSSEALGVFDPAAFRRFRHGARQMGYGIRIVVYVRSIADHALSTYHQHVKGGLTRHDLVEFLRHEYGRPQASLLASLSEVVPADEMLVRNYDRAAGALVPDFLTNVLGLTDISAFATAQGRVNRSLTPVEIALMRIMAPMFATQYQARVASDAIIYGLPHADRQPSISPEAMAVIEELHAADLEAMNGYIPATPVGLKSAALAVREEPEPRIGEAERVLAAMLAGIIRTADLHTFR